MAPEKSNSSNFKVDGPKLRHCFDPYSAEWNDSSIEGKISTIGKIIEEKDTNCFALAMKTFNSLREEYGKTITTGHLVAALGSMIDYLINERKLNSKE